MKIAAAILTGILMIAVFVQYAFGIINPILMQGLLWITILVFGIYFIAKKINKKK